MRIVLGFLNGSYGCEGQLLDESLLFVTEMLSPGELLLLTPLSGDMVELDERSEGLVKVKGSGLQKLGKHPVD